jgi:hypothetical protein
MKPRVLPLTSKNFGEWLASLGLLQLIAATSEEAPALSFEKNGTALLHSSLQDEELVSLVRRSTELGSIRVQYHAAASGRNESNGAVSIDNVVFENRVLPLSSDANVKEFASAAEPKEGCYVGFDIGRGISVRHYVGKALCDLAELRSPLKTWSGQVTFSRVFLSVREAVTKITASTFQDLLGATSRETQRFRFDHAWEDYLDDGNSSLVPGAQMRPVVEWLALLGLAFFPPEWGWKNLSPKRQVLRSHIWFKPLDAATTALALHSGQLTPASEFQLIPSGRLKKIRFLSHCN